MSRYRALSVYPDPGYELMARAASEHSFVFEPTRARVSYLVDLMVGKIGFSYEPIQAFPTRQGCTPESYELVATFISV